MRSQLETFFQANYSNTPRELLTRMGFNNFQDGFIAIRLHAENANGYKFFLDNPPLNSINNRDEIEKYLDYPFFLSENRKMISCVSAIDDITSLNTKKYILFSSNNSILYKKFEGTEQIDLAIVRLLNT